MSKEVPLALSTDALTSPLYRPSFDDGGKNEGEGEDRNALGTINGCFVPCCLNILGVILFLRLSWAVGQGGVMGTFGVFALGETMAILTVLSFSAIVSNGDMSGGGSYFMISRSLGPEMGGAIGLLFYLAYAVGVSFYIVGFATEVQQTWFPVGPGEVADPWILRGVGSIALFVVLVISFIGAEVFAKFNVWFFVLQFLAIGIGLVSFVFNVVPELSGGGESYGFNMTNLKENMWPEYTTDSTTGMTSDFHYVFAICFPAATGIMEGANLSGDQKDPAKSIPKGTLWAVFTAICTYILLIITFAAGFPRATLQNNLAVFQDTCFISKYIVVFGILISALSSALGSLFGGSRVLQALARDELFPALNIFRFGSVKGDEPRVAVLATWVISQACLFIGDLDVVAPIITSFFCLSYALCNFTCFSLRVTGAPNFRPSFKYYTWHTALAGTLLNLFVMFYLNMVYGLVSMSVLILVVIYLVYRGPAKPWGNVTQAIIYHQVRKYLLKLDESRKDVKFWRPSLLHLCDSLEFEVLEFCNKLKKGGLFVVGHVLVGDIQQLSSPRKILQQKSMDTIRKCGLKAFAQAAVSHSARLGYQFMMCCSGLGGMNINTVLLPFIEPAGDAASEEPRKIPVASASEYLQILGDTLTLEKNLIVSRNFSCEAADGSSGSSGSGSDSSDCVDVWLVPALEAPAHMETMETESDAGPEASTVKFCCFEGRVNTPSARGAGFSFNTTSSLMLQLAHILDNSQLRVWQVVDNAGFTSDDISEQQKGLVKLLKAARINVNPSDVTVLNLRHESMSSSDYAPPATATNADGSSGEGEGKQDGEGSANSRLDQRELCARVNGIIRNHSSKARAVFIPLPHVPRGSSNSEGETVAVSEADACDYLSLVADLTKALPPSALVAAGERTDFISTTI